MDPIHKKTLELMQEYLDNTPDDKFLTEYLTLEKGIGPLVTDFIIVDYPPMDVGTQGIIPAPQIDELVVNAREFMAEYKSPVDYTIAITLPDPVEDVQEEVDNRPYYVRYLKKRKHK